MAITVVAQPSITSFSSNPPRGTPSNVSAVDRQDVLSLFCHLRSCDQAISGRNLIYERALEIVQDEEYLEAADLGVIRRKKREVFESRAGGRKPSFIEVLSTLQIAVGTEENERAVNPAQTMGQILFAGGLMTLLGFVLTGSSSSTPLPGTPGGGQRPIGNSPIVLEALELVPPGLQAVAVFPPYSTPRTRNAVSVIFRESGRARNIRPDVFFRSFRQRTFVRRPRRFLRKATSRRDRRRIWGQTIKLKVNRGKDRFKEGLFGFRTRVRLVENEPCALGVTCDDRGNTVVGRYFDSIYRKVDRQTGEEFSSDGPPECRVFLNPNGCLAL